MDADLSLEALLASFAAPSPFPPPGSAGSRSGPPGEEEVMSEIERFLMGEKAAAEAGGVEGIGVEEFFDALFDGEEGEGKGSEAGGSTDGEGGKEREGVVVTPETEEEKAECDDPVSKKKLRQIRNRDSAMKSRERKKTYVKDLETKSKYLEAECRRLSYALQCCAAQNMALRQSMLKDRHVGAPTALQESAVLTETLPLVSLLWLGSIVCLFLMPVLPNQNPAALSRAGKDVATAARKTSSEQSDRLDLLLHGRRCKGTRARMKLLDTLPLQAAAAAC